MTSINAVKFNDHMGMMICDEERGWNEQNMAILSVEKIRPIIVDEIRDRYSTAASYGNTGTSTIGDELKYGIMKRIEKIYKDRVEANDGPPGEFMTIEEIAYEVYKMQIAMKKNHLDMTFKSRYGFNADEFIQGWYESDAGRIEIKDKEIIKEMEANLIWKDRKGEMTPVFLNAGMVAGYEPKEGFRIFAFSLIDFRFEPVQEIFLPDGSGRDQCSLVFTEFLNGKTVPERRGDIDPLEGTIWAIHAVNKAVDFNIGVNGYFNIILFNGKADKTKDIQREINDDRSKLASDIVRACSHQLIPQDLEFELIDNLLYKNKTFEEMEDRLFTKAPDAKKLDRFLRGYRVELPTPH